MSRRFWAACILTLALGCATSEDAGKTSTSPKKRASARAQAIDTEDDDTAPPPTAAAPKAAEPEEPTPAAPKASAEAPPPEEPKRTAADPFGDVGFKEVDQKAWLAGLRDKIAQQEKVAPAELRVSPGLLRVAYVRSPAPAQVKPGRRAPPRRHEVVVVDNQGRPIASFRAVAAKHGDEPPKELRFLSEEKLVYEVVEPPPEETPAKPAPHKPARRPAPHAKAAKASKKGKALGKAAAEPPKPAAPPPPTRTFVIQPIAPHARPLKCVGVHFVFTKEHDRLAYVAGKPEAGFVAVEGAQIYPRRGRAVIATAPAWSKDGHSLAFLEAPPERAARLVLVAELDNPTGDTTWELPPTAATEGAQVFWAGSGKLVVGKTLMRPIFSAAFTKESPNR